MERISRKRGIAVMLGLVAVFVGACALSMNVFLSGAANAEEEVVHTERMQPEVATPGAGLEATEGLTLKTSQPWDEGKTAISPQYAAARASEASKRAFGSPFTGRVYLAFGPGSDQYANKSAEDGTWGIRAEADGIVVFGTVDDQTGRVVSLGKYSRQLDWEWFDTVDDPAVVQKREEARKRAEETEEGQDAQSRPLTGEALEEYKASHEQAYRELQALAEEKKDEPHNAKAIELVNSLDLADGTKAVSCKVVNELGASSYDENNNPYPVEYRLELELDNGGYVLMGMYRDNMELVSYSLQETSWLGEMGGRLAVS